MIPYGRQSISEQDIDAVVAVLKSDFLTQGPCIAQFERALCTYTGARYAIVVNSATSALHLACLALGLGPGDLLWTSPISYVASANCALYCGADVDFIDINPNDYCIDVDVLEQRLQKADVEGRLPKVIVPVHLAGRPCDMRRIRAVTAAYGIALIEDASHAIGARYDAGPIGDCRYSDICIFSFHPVKVMTTGEGGAALCNNAELAEKMRLLSSHGITRDEGLMTEVSHGPWYYQQLELGYNYRMTDIQAALGISQLARLEECIAARRAIVERYITALQDAPLQLPPADNASLCSAHHLFIVRLKSPAHSKNQRQVFDALRDAGVGVNVHYIPIYRQPYYQARKSAFLPCPEAEHYYSEAISLPIFPALTVGEQHYICASLQAILSRCQPERPVPY